MAAEEDRLIDQRTGEAALPDGAPPPRAENLRTPPYSSLSIQSLWEELKLSDQLAIVALKEPTLNRGYFRGRNLVSEKRVAVLAAEVLKVKGVSQATSVRITDREMPVMPDGRRYPGVIVHVADPATLERLRTLKVVDFIEPLYPTVCYMDVGGHPIGCSMPAYVGNVYDGRLFASPSPGQGDLVPWAYDHMKVEATWRMFGTNQRVPGQGILVAVVDTGVYTTQTQFLFPKFGFPLNPGLRNFSQTVFGGGDAIQCNHGTRITGLAAAPADGGLQANIAGIAWGASVFSAKVGNGVVHTDTSVPALVSALNAAAARGAQVVLMAWGGFFTTNTVRDTIAGLYEANPKMIMVAAAGTEEPAVVFPATMERETVAVSIVNAPHSIALNTREYELYGPEIAYGEPVDFVAVNGPTDIPVPGNGVFGSMTTDDNGNVVLASSLSPDKVKEITTLGGSSSGVALIGGAIAVLWSRIPELTRSGVIARLQRSANCAIAGLDTPCVGNVHNNQVGWGVPDLYVASGGARRLWVSGPPAADSGVPYTVRANIDGDPRIFSFTWNTGETGPSLTATVAPGGSNTHTVTARNLLDGTTLPPASLTVFSGATTTRTLFATETAQHWASFLDGWKDDVTINSGASLPQGCAIVGVSGQELTTSSGSSTAVGAAGNPIDRGNRGYSIGRLIGDARSLDVVIHAWHDGVSAIRVRPSYTVIEAAGVDCNSTGRTQTSP